MTERKVMALEDRVDALEKIVHGHHGGDDPISDSNITPSNGATIAPATDSAPHQMKTDIDDDNKVGPSASASRTAVDPDSIHEVDDDETEKDDDTAERAGMTEREKLAAEPENKAGLDAYRGIDDEKNLEIVSPGAASYGAPYAAAKATRPAEGRPEEQEAGVVGAAKAEHDNHRAIDKDAEAKKQAKENANAVKAKAAQDKAEQAEAEKADAKTTKAKTATAKDTKADKAAKAS